MDELVLTCAANREGVSARIDGETPPLDEAAVDRHMASCPDCREWERRAVDLSRWLSVRAATPVRDLSGRIIAMSEAAASWRQLRRGLLAAVGVLQVALGVTQLFVDGFGHGAHLHGDLAWSQHLLDEGAAWNVAVGVGLLWVARRPRYAAGFLVPLIVFVVILGGISIRDLVATAVPLGRVLTHLLIVAGLVLAAVVHRDHRHHPGPGLGAIELRQQPVGEARVARTRKHA